VENRYEWDSEKAEANFAKHGVPFSEARTVFNDPFAIASEDEDRAVGEPRYRAIGWSARARLLFVVYTERGEVIRLISARPATRRERKLYEG
jgi:uncharacterized protein